MGKEHDQRSPEKIIDTGQAKSDSMHEIILRSNARDLSRNNRPLNENQGYGQKVSLAFWLIFHCQKDSDTERSSSSAQTFPRHFLLGQR
jgi:hypothetical protein